MNLLERYRKRLQTDEKLNSLRNRIRGSTNYADADAYAARTGEILADELTYEAKSYPSAYNLDANEVDWGELASQNEIVQQQAEAYLEQLRAINEGTSVIQNNINDSMGVGLEVKQAAFDPDRTLKLINEYALSGDKQAMEDAIVSHAQSYVDETVKKNFDLHSQVGFRAKLVREAEPAGTVTKPHDVFSKKGKKYTYMRSYQVPCKWCASLAGTYDYDKVQSGEAVFRRHKGCRCTVTYIEDNKAQDVHSKIEWTAGDAKSQADAIQFKQMQIEAEAKAQEIARQERKHWVDILMDQYGYTAKEANIFYNMWKTEISRHGLDRLMSN